jgi:hypothetical protein
MIATKLRKNVCRIECGEEQGTGFLISSNLILTAYHVVCENEDENEEIKVYFSSKKETVYGEIHELISETWKNLDVAIIQLDENIDFYEEIKILDISLDDGMNWISRGFPLVKNGRGENFILESNNYINEQHNELHANNDIDLNFNSKLTTYAGYSGAPLIVDECIVGMIRSELPQNGIARELYGLSIKYFNDLLEKVGVTVETMQCNSVLPLTIQNNILDFLDKYYDAKLENDNCLKVFAPKLDDKDQDINSFVNELYESMHTFIGNRRDLASSQQHRMADNLRKKFRENFSNNLLEELIGYNLLESDLKAPKIFTSIEQGNLKSSIHLYDVNSEKIFVLSLPIINKNINDSISLLENLISENISFKINSSMITESFLRNSFDDEQKEYIETLIIPAKNVDLVDIEKAFGVFLGFDISELPNKYSLKNKEFKIKYEEMILDMSSKIKKHLEDYIIEKFSSVYYFIYLIPFDSTEDLISISERILSE